MPTPPPSSPPPPPPPPPSWPPPTAPAPPAPRPSAGPPNRRAAVLVVVGTLAAFTSLVVGAALVIGWLAGPVAGAGYEELSEEERASTVARATQVGTSLDRWWSVQLRELGGGRAFVPVGPRLTDGDDGVRCDDEDVVPDDDLHDNAWAALCHEGPVVAFDPATFRGSDVALQIILAHEWAHVAQALDPRLDEIWVDPAAPYAETELQADCYAGAWAATNLDRDEQELAVLEVRAIGDPPDVPPDDPDGHGTADEREAAFLLGLDQGITACLPDSFDARRNAAR